MHWDCVINTSTINIMTCLKFMYRSEGMHLLQYPPMVHLHLHHAKHSRQSAGFHKSGHTIIFISYSLMYYGPAYISNHMHGIMSHKPSTSESYLLSSSSLSSQSCTHTSWEKCIDHSHTAVHKSCSPWETDRAAQILQLHGIYIYTIKVNLSGIANTLIDRVAI